MARRGILSYGAYLPYRRLDRTTIAEVAGKGGGKGTRTVASYDQDTTTLAVEAARLTLRAVPDPTVDSLWFATTHPAYADKTNATAIHAALRLPATSAAFDVNGSARSTVGALRAALTATGPALLVAADTVTGLPGSADETSGGDGAAALLVGDIPTEAPVGSSAGAPSQGDDSPRPLATVVGQASVTEEFLDRWRAPGVAHGQNWEERFGEGRYVDAGVQAWHAALDDAGVEAAQVDAVAVAGPHSRATTSLVKKLGLAEQAAASPIVAALPGAVGYTGAAQPLVALTALLEDIGPEKLVALVCLTDGCDVVLLRTADVLAASCPAWPLASQLSAGGRVPYGTYLAWRGYLPVDPPRRPTPSRPSASAAGRSTDWKFGFVGSADDDGTVHLPPAAGDEHTVPMADALGTVVTFTIDRMAYSPSPPVVFAVVDFDGGGRLPIELTDVDAADIAVGDRVELTFRRLFTADGIHNYFWKARPARSESTPSKERG